MVFLDHLFVTILMQVDALSFLGFVGPVFDDAQFVSVAPVFLDDDVFVGD